MEKWEDISIVSEGIMAPHSSFNEENKIDLNGKWLIKCVKGTDTVSDDFHLENDGLTSINIPTCIETKGFGKPYYYGANFPPAINKKKIPSIDHQQNYVSILKRVFEIPQQLIGKKIIMHLGAVKSAVYIYINDQYVGLSKTSMMPIEIDISDFVVQGTNKLALQIYNYSDATYLECQDMWYLSGLYRDSYIYVVNKEYIEDLYAHCALLNDYKDALLHVEVKTNAKKGQLKINIANKEKTIDVTDDTSVDFELKNVKLWSAEKPNLYDLSASLIIDKNVVQTRTIKYGFKEVKVDHDKGLFLVNGKKVKLKGFNYHSFTPEDGYYVPDEVYEKDIKLMKEMNVNAIRTSHYPQDDCFYDLCDKYGIYVMDECNLETHGVRKKVPGEDERWLPHCLDRIQRMVLRDRNHACITIWSLGNESDLSSIFFKMKEKTLALDRTRPIHFEPGKNTEISDFLCEGYTDLETEKKYANGEEIVQKPTFIQRLIPLLMTKKSMSFDYYKTHPILDTEYNYCTGNASSDTCRHVETFDKSDRWCGGFVWDFKDKALLKENMFAYGGDFGVNDQKGNLGCNGACDPHSIPHGVMYELQYAFRPIVTSYKDGKLIVYNRNFFTNVNEYKCDYTVERNGDVIEKHNLTIDVEPREHKEVGIQIDSKLDQIGLYTLNIRYSDNESVKAYDQFVLAENINDCQNHTGAIVDNGNQIVLASSDTKYVIDANTGDIAQIIHNNRNILKTNLRPSFYRPVTDGEAGFIGIAFGSYKRLDNFGKYSINGINHKPTIEIKNNKIIVQNRLKDLSLTRTYAIINDKCRVQVQFITHKNAPNRIGLQVELDKTFDSLDYIGRGPNDTYWGRKESGMISKHHQSVARQDDYMRPQEHGNKTDIYSCNLIGKDCRLIIEKDDKPFAVSIWPYSLKQLTEAEHNTDLPNHELTTLNIDLIQNGLGDCFVHCPNDYKIQANTNYQYSFSLSVK